MGAQTPEEAGEGGVGGASAGLGGGGSWAQPAPLAFDIREIERFRYRVEDTLKKVCIFGVCERGDAAMRRRCGFNTEGSGVNAAMLKALCGLRTSRLCDFDRNRDDPHVPSCRNTR